MRLFLQLVVLALSNHELLRETKKMDQRMLAEDASHFQQTSFREFEQKTNPVQVLRAYVPSACSWSIYQSNLDNNILLKMRNMSIPERD
jgi:hypothetical protein